MYLPLTHTQVRLREEVYLDQSFHESFLDNKFDSQLNTFKDIRREADLYEWGSQVLWPGLFADATPACGEVGRPGHFQSARPLSATASGPFKGGCNDETWADGEGVLGRRGATGFTVPELVSRMNQMDWTEGLLFTQARVAPTSAEACNTLSIGGECYPEIYAPSATLDQAPL